MPYYVFYVLHGQKVFFLFLQNTNVMLWISVSVLCVFCWIHWRTAVVRSSCTRLFAAVAECCPAEAAVFCSESSVEFHPLIEAVEAEKGKWILDPVQQLFELLHCFSSRCLTCCTQSLTNPPSLFFFLSLFLTLIPPAPSPPFLPLPYSLPPSSTMLSQFFFFFAVVIYMKCNVMVSS